MARPQCPQCGERNALRGEQVGESIQLTCESCDHRWMREAAQRCRLCGSEELRYTPKPLWEKGRGDQRTPAGRIDAYACWSCGGLDVTSDDARPGPTPEPYRVDPV